MLLVIRLASLSPSITGGPMSMNAASGEKAVNNSSGQTIRDRLDLVTVLVKKFGDGFRNVEIVFYNQNF
jgi:hypothetical protein